MVFNSRPPVKKLVPEWDLSLVLEAIQKAPFEPMKTVHLKYATWKTVLLLAITSFRLCSDLHGVFNSQLIRYARAFSSYGCFILRATRLSNKLPEQGYVKERLKKFYGRYEDLIKQYGISL